MTIDERLEALTTNLELRAHEGQKHDRQIQELIELSKQDGEHIRGLVRIAEIRERRLTGFEGSESV